MSLNQEVRALDAIAAKWERDRTEASRECECVLWVITREARALFYTWLHQAQHEAIDARASLNFLEVGREK